MYHTRRGGSRAPSRTIDATDLDCPFFENTLFSLFQKLEGPGPPLAPLMSKNRDIETSVDTSPLYCDKAVSNARRLQRMWECEIDQAKSSGKRPSLAKCVWKFCRTRILISSLLFLIAACFQFIAPVRTKNYIEQIEFVFHN